MADDVSELVREVREVLARERPAGPHDSAYHQRLLLTLHGFCAERVPDAQLDDVLVALDEEARPADLGLVLALAHGRPAARFLTRVRWRVGHVEAEATLARARTRAEELRRLLEAWQARRGALDELAELLRRRRQLRTALEGPGASQRPVDLVYELARVEAALAKQPPENLQRLAHESEGASMAEEARRLLQRLPRFYRRGRTGREGLDVG